MQIRWKRFAATGLTVALIFSAGVLLGSGGAFKRLNLPGGSNSLPFSHAIVAGETIYIAGTLGLDPETGRAPTDVDTEIRLALDGVKKKLELAGASMDDLVAVQIFCPDLSLYDQFNAIYKTYFDAGYPTRSFIGSGPLLRGGRFEINGIAVKN